MLQCLIIDDEPLARRVLENYIARTPELVLAGSCPNAVGAYEKIIGLKPDLLFLDIRMPSIDGLAFIRSLKKPPGVIFTTAFAEYAAESYELNAIDYLLKPFSYERFLSAISKSMKTVGEKAADFKAANVVPAIPAEKDHLYIRSANSLVRVFYADILYIEARKDYLKIVTRQGVHLAHQTMMSMIALLPAAWFIRVHRSYIVSLRAIDKLGKTALEIGPVSIPVSGTYRKQVAAFLQGDE